MWPARVIARQRVQLPPPSMARITFILPTVSRSRNHQFPALGALEDISRQWNPIVIYTSYFICIFRREAPTGSSTARESGETYGLKSRGAKRRHTGSE